MLEQLQGDRALEVLRGDQVLVLLPQELLDRLLDRLGLEFDDEDEDGLINNIDMSNNYQYVQTLTIIINTSASDMSPRPVDMAAAGLPFYFPFKQMTT